MNTKQFLMATATLVVLAGCSEQGREAFHSADQTSAQAAQQIGKAIKTDADATGHILKKESAVADKKMQADWKNAKVEAAQSEETMKVKTGLSSAAGLDTSNLTVETMGKTVYLKGVVPTPAQKKQAEQVAKGIAGNAYKVNDQLTISTK